MAKRKFHWLDRRVSQLGPYLTLVLSQDELNEALKGLTQEYVHFPVSGAECTTLTKDVTHELCAIISLSERAQQNNNSIEIAGLLVHEAVHVWQRYAEHLGERRPGDEQEAYAIQGISQELMMEYTRRLNG